MLEWLAFVLIWFPWWQEGKESVWNMGDLGLILGSGRSTGEGNGNPLQCSCLGNLMDRGAWLATVHEVAESDIGERLTHTHAMPVFTYLN